MLCTRVHGVTTKAVILETEAYAGETDKASHAFGGRRTARTEPMYAEGGIAYVYLCYGIHHLFNVVTNTSGTPHAVLIRGGRPVSGQQTMLRRRRRKVADKRLMAGPGTLSQALGIKSRMTGTDLSGKRIWLEDQELTVEQKHVEVGPRVGVDYAAEHAALPYRFLWHSS